MSNERLVEIETRLAFAENAVNELSDVVYRQSQTIDALSEQYEQLKKQLTAAANEDTPPPPEAEIPPHY